MVVKSRERQRHVRVFSQVTGVHSMDAQTCGCRGVLGDLLVGFSFLGGGTIGVGGHGDDEGDTDVEEVDDRKRAVA